MSWGWRINSSTRNSPSRGPAALFWASHLVPSRRLRWLEGGCTPYYPTNVYFWVLLHFYVLIWSNGIVPWLCRIPENYVQCPSCDRWFGPKAADRHIEWCTSKLFRLPSGNMPCATEKKRWENRVNVSPFNKTKKNWKTFYSPEVSNSSEDLVLASSCWFKTETLSLLFHLQIRSRKKNWAFCFFSPMLYNFWKIMHYFHNN